MGAFLHVIKKEKLQQSMFEYREDGEYKIKSYIPGQSPYTIAKEAGIEIPKDTKVIVVYE